jgi:hypothetical protein
VSAAPNLSHTTYPAAFGDAVAAQVPELSRDGIGFIDFTGGEPTLASAFLGKVSAASFECGIECGAVTAAHWASTSARAASFLKGFPHIHNWDISTDVYHVPFVPIKNVENAFHAVRDAGGEPLIRIAYHEPMTYEDALVIDTVRAFAGDQIAFQPIGPIGLGVVRDSVDRFWHSAPEN